MYTCVFVSALLYRLFPSCLLPRFQNESWCETIQMKMRLICIKVNMREKLTRTRFETEVKKTIQKWPVAFSVTVKGEALFCFVVVL